MPTLRSSVEQVVRLLRPDATDCHVVSWAESFASLWDVDGASVLEWLRPNRTLIVIWDRTPSGPGDAARMSDFVGPIGWALAVGLSRSVSAEPPGRVVLVDCRIESVTGPAALLYQLQCSDKPALPWLTVAPWPGDTILSTLARAVAPDAVTDQRKTAAAQTLASLRDLWVGAFAGPANAADRHAVANVLGPHLLLGDIAETDKTNKALGALGTLLRLLKVCPKGDGKSSHNPFPWVTRNEWEPAISDFVLIDDLHAEGWAKFLEDALDAKGRLRAYAAMDETGPESFVEFLEDGAAQVPVRGIPGESWDRRVMFLDLRLFSRRPVTEEMAFFSRLLSIARVRQRPVDAGDLEAVQRCIDASARENDDYYAAITLLPRLLADIDPFLPIVVFSSTQQRAVVERLRPFENVLLDFDKPRLVGQTLDTLRCEAQAKFQRVIRRAMEIAEARALCRKCLRTADRGTGERGWSVLEAEDATAPSSADVARPKPTGTGSGMFEASLAEELASMVEPALAVSPQMVVSVSDLNVANSRSASQGESEPVLDVFIDESADKYHTRFAVGGVAILYDRASGPGQLAEQLKKENLAWGVAEGWPPDRLGDTLPTTFLPKEAASSEYFGPLERFEKCVETAGGQILAFGITDQYQRELETIDGQFHSMLAEVLEQLLFVTLPAIKWHGVPLAIDAGSRVFGDGPTKPDGRKLTPEELERNFGVHFTRKGERKGTLFYSLSEVQVYALARNIFETRRKPEMTGRLRRARPVQLRDYPDLHEWQAAWVRAGRPEDGATDDRVRRYLSCFRYGKWNLPRPLQEHFVSDWIARLIRRNDSDVKNSLDNGLLKRWFERGFLDERATARVWLEASRAEGPGRTAESLLCVWKARRRPRDPYSLGRWIDLESARWVRGLDALAFQELTQRMALERRVRCQTTAAKASAPSRKADPKHEELRKQIFECVTTLVAESTDPVPLPVLENKVIAKLGVKVRETRWAGAGGLKKLLLQAQGPGLEITPDDRVRASARVSPTPVAAVQDESQAPSSAPATSASESIIPEPPTATDLAELREQIQAIVKKTVQDAQEPVMAQARVAHSVVAALGEIVSRTKWAGAGSFKAFLQQTPDLGVEIVPDRPGYLRVSGRVQAPTGAEEHIERERPQAARVVKIVRAILEGERR